MLKVGINTLAFGIFWDKLPLVMAKAYSSLGVLAIMLGEKISLSKECTAGQRYVLDQNHPYVL